MNPTDGAVEKATAGLDDDLQKTDEVIEKPVSEEKVVEKDNPEENPKKEKTPEDDKGYTASEIDQPEKVSSEEEEPTEIDTNGLNDEAKYIVENLPYITARIKDGENVKEVQIKSWTQLPDDVNFATKRDEIAFMNALTAQENRALDLQNKFQQGQQEKQTQQFEERENEAVRADITELQKAGELPKFKVKPDDAEFDKDPATKEVQKVLDFMHERNEQYLKEYQQGRAYRHLGFREAFVLQQKSKPNKAEVEEDAERQGLANKTNVTRGMASKELKKPTVKAGTTVDQILARIDAEEW